MWSELLVDEAIVHGVGGGAGGFRLRRAEKHPHWAAAASADRASSCRFARQPPPLQTLRRHWRGPEVISQKGRIAKLLRTPRRHVDWPIIAARPVVQADRPSFQRHLSQKPSASLASQLGVTTGARTRACGRRKRHLLRQHRSLAVAQHLMVAGLVASG